MDTKVVTFNLLHILTATNYSANNNSSTNYSGYSYPITNFTAYNYPSTNISQNPYPITNLSAYIYPNLFDFSAPEDNTTLLHGPGRYPTQADSSLVRYRLSHQAVFLLPAYGLILLLSVGGNLLVLATLLQHRAMRTPTNILLLNLSISDLLLAVVCVPFTLTGSLLRDFIFGKFACKLIPYLQAVSVSVSAWTLVTISWERYCGICQPLRSRGWRSNGSARKMTATVWVGSMLLMAPIALTSHLLPIGNTGRHKCREAWPNTLLEQLFSIGLMFILLLLPLLLMMVAYTAITKVLRKSIINDRQNSLKYPSTRVVQNSACTRKNFSSEKLFENSTVGSRPNVNTIEECHQADVSSDNIAWRTGEPSNLDYATGRSDYESHYFTNDEFSEEIARVALKSSVDTNFRRRDTESPLGHRDGCRSTEDVPTVTTCSTVPKNANKQPLEAGVNDGMNHHSAGQCEDLNGVYGRSEPGDSLTCPPSSSRHPFSFHRHQAKYKKRQKFYSHIDLSTCDDTHGVISPELRTIFQTETTSNFSNSFQYDSGHRLSSERERESYQNSCSLKKNDSEFLRSNNGLTRTPVSISNLSTGDESNVLRSTMRRSFPARWGRSGCTLSSNRLNMESGSSTHATNFTRSLTSSCLRSTSSIKSLKNKERIIKMIGVVVLEFFVCWTPLYVLNTVALFNPSMVYNFLGMNGVAVVQLLAYCSACCNPITYCFMSKSFRGAFFNVIRCRKSFSVRYSENTG